MGRKTKKASAGPELTEDELLDKAIKDNAAIPRTPTFVEVIAKLDQVLLLHLCAIRQGSKQIVPGVDAELCWYADVLDAKAALSLMQDKMPKLPGHSLGLDFTPLGRAFSMSQGWTKQPGKTPPMRLQPSSKVLDACGTDGLTALESQLPSPIKQQNPRQAAFPLFYLEELQNESVMPFFFTRDDLVTCWMSSGRPFEDIPAQLSVIDLRVLVARMLQEPSDWLARLLLVPPQCLVDLMQFIDGVGDQLTQLGTIAAKATGEVLAEAKAAHAEAVASGAEPPPLE